MLGVADRPIVHEIAGLKIMPMTLVSIELPDLEKLDTLRRLDQFRNWQSLDEKRYCLVCGKLITGREIQVIGDGFETGSDAGHLPNRALQFHSNGLGASHRRNPRRLVNAQRQSFAAGRKLKLGCARTALFAPHIGWGQLNGRKFLLSDFSLWANRFPARL